ncbi:MAG: ABC transporter ATP-binding protein [Desulfuromonas sp.]|mgnify:CR=1 FL=1|nr:MAG: ABC transporter ATP-binding protein [Desulfuromonas sp.]
MKGLASLLPYARRYRKILIAGVFWLLLTNLLAMLLPRLLQQGIDALAAGDYDLLLYAALAMVLTALLRGAFRIRSRHRFLHTARFIEVDLRHDLFAHLLRQPLPFFSDFRTGDLLSRCTNDLGSLRMFAGFGLMTIANSAILYLATLGVLLTISPSLTLVALIPYPFLLLAARSLSRRLLVASSRVQQGVGEVSSAVEEGITGIEVIKAQTLEALQQERFEALNRDYLGRNLALARLRSLMQPIMTLVGPLGTLLVLAYGGAKVTAQELTLGELVAVNVYIVQLSMPTLMLGWVLSLLQRASASMERVQELLDHTPPEDAGDEAPALSEGMALELKGLSYRYGSAATPALQGVSCDIPAGTLVGIAGPPGSGKSTLLRLLSGLDPLSADMILCDGIDLTALDGAAHRRRLAAVPQEGRLFSGSVAENLFYAVDADAQNDARMVELLRAVALEDLIKDAVTAQGALVGEGGKSLSGGQRQRVALGRALARGGALWLLDDPFSHLDALTANRVWEALQPHLVGRTVLLVSARLALLERCDTVLVFDQGALVESGAPQTLRQQSGLYAQLWEQERLHDELEGLG